MPLSWGCVCPYHTALIEQLFPDRLQDPTLPLFPTMAGGAVTENDTQEFAEHLAVMTGEPIYNAHGVKNVGRHTWRGMGAIYFSELNLEVYKMNLLARWASPVILHYARNAPSRKITEVVWDLNDIISFGNVIRTLKNDIKDIKAKTTGIDGITQKVDIAEELDR